MKKYRKVFGWVGAGWQHVVMLRLRRQLDKARQTVYKLRLCYTDARNWASGEQHD